MGYKLKIGLIDIFTAENVEWKLEKDFDVSKFKTGSGLTYNDDSLKGRQSFSDIQEYFKSRLKEKNF